VLSGSQTRTVVAELECHSILGTPILEQNGFTLEMPRLSRQERGRDPNGTYAVMESTQGTARVIEEPSARTSQ